MKYERGTILLTKDGRKTGNAIVLGFHDNRYYCESDFGNVFTLVEDTVEDKFYIVDYSDMAISLEENIKRWYNDRYHRIMKSHKTDLIVRNKAKCKKCKSVIESKHVHDYVKCKCGAIVVDGGHEYLRRIGEPKDIEGLSIVFNRY